MRVANKVVLNTGILYAKMLVTIGLNLYATRFVLAALGVSDYGIYNLVAGVVVMLSFLNVAMAGSTQRYLSYHMADGVERVRQIFASSVRLHFLISFMIVAFLELGGIYLFSHVLSIPEDRIQSAKIAFQFMVVSTFFTVNAVPYDAVVVAHENMIFDAITGVLESVIKFVIALGLTYMEGDRLVLYGAAIAALTVIMRVIKSIYCAGQYAECRISYFKLGGDKKIFREIFSFTVWNTLGAIMLVGSTQGIAVVLNFFYGAVVNAGYGIAYQVNSQINAFSMNMLKALTPQIIKSESQGDRERMLSLSMTASKFSFFLLGLFTIPLIIEMPFVLDLWLREAPPYALAFCRLILVVSLINQLSSGIMASMQSVGKIKWYSAAISIIMLMNIPISYFFLKVGCRPEAVFVVAIIIEVLALFVRVLFAKHYVQMSVGGYFMRVVLRAVFTLGLATLAAVLVPYFFAAQSFLRLCLTVIVFLIVYFSALWLIGLSAHDKDKLQGVAYALSVRIKQNLKMVK